MINNNREVLFQRLIVGLDELMRANEIEVNVDVDSCAAGFQGVAGHILALIKTMEDEGSIPREIIAEIRNTLDDGTVDHTLQ